MSEPCKLSRWASLLPLVLLCGCPLRPQVTAAPPAAVPAPAPAAQLGTPYAVAAGESLLTILVYRGGALASAGHNHVIASHALTGTIYVPADMLKSSFEVRIPVATLTVDEEALRAQEHRAEFPPDVPEAARQGTRHNMLGAALLDSEANPEIVLRALGLQATQPAAAGAALARIQATVRGQPQVFSAPVHYERAGERFVVSGETLLRQTDLGLKPFSAMLGALQVQDEMRVRFRIVAHAAPTAHAPH